MSEATEPDPSLVPQMTTGFLVMSLVPGQTHVRMPGQTGRAVQAPETSCSA